MICCVDSFFNIWSSEAPIDFIIDHTAPFWCFIYLDHSLSPCQLKTQSSKVKVVPTAKQNHGIAKFRWHIVVHHMSMQPKYQFRFIAHFWVLISLSCSFLCPYSSYFLVFLSFMTSSLLALSPSSSSSLHPEGTHLFSFFPTAKVIQFWHICDLNIQLLDAVEF